jgi:carboxymethylenebutenolidase
MKKILFLLVAFTCVAAFGQRKKKVAVAKSTMSCCVPNNDDSKDYVSMKQFTKDKQFFNAHDAPAPYVFAENDGDQITFPTPDGKTSTAQMWPSPQPSYNYLIVIHEYWGLNDYVKKMSQQLRNDLGNVNVIAVDLYDGKVATTSQEASKYMSAVKKERAEAIFKGLYAFEKDAANFYSIGWCFGGGWSLQASLLAGDKAGGCVMYYGMPEKNVTALKNLKCDVLGVFANNDKWINPAVVDTFKMNMKAAGKELELHQYDADHAFANPSQTDRYDAKAADDAYYYVKEFLSKKLDQE